MKKIKIMLMAIALLGVVGGALAFKAKSKFGAPICTVAAIPVGTTFTCTNSNFPNGQLCPTRLLSKTTLGNAINICWTATVNNTCTNVRCTATASTTTIE
ncbi:MULTISPECIES: hypothetical protein [Niastella]|uniref:Ig-like domain-containing protein n=1 Tax=Niastella soli TaxID=2821487 RepID=A0ABS3YU04_9BACT|nr:hypothetical protein [Niastella soli]MBO9201404.1 hypothetical protein [Niastella soli]